MQVRMRNVNEVEIFLLGDTTILKFKRKYNENDQDGDFQMRYINTDKKSKPICTVCGEPKTKKHKCSGPIFYTEDELKEFMLSKFNSNDTCVLTVNGIKIQHKMSF